MRKIVETRSSPSNTIKDSTIIHNPSGSSLHLGKGVTHDCASILDSIAKGTSCFHNYSHGASLHRQIFTLIAAMSVVSPYYNCTLGESQFQFQSYSLSG